MNLRILYVGKSEPWIDKGIEKYTRRMPNLSLEAIKEYPQHNCFRRMLKQAGSSFRVLLDSQGIERTSEELAKALLDWSQSHKYITFLIGNDDGFTSEDRKAADTVWSLSPLTFPYMLARLIVVEQLYRAKSIIDGHPYHRLCQPHEP